MFMITVLFNVFMSLMFIITVLFNVYDFLLNIFKELMFSVGLYLFPFIHSVWISTHYRWTHWGILPTHFRDIMRINKPYIKGSTQGWALIVDSWDLGDGLHCYMSNERLQRWVRVLLPKSLSCVCLSVYLSRAMLRLSDWGRGADRLRPQEAVATESKFHPQAQTRRLGLRLQTGGTDYGFRPHPQQGVAHRLWAGVSPGHTLSLPSGRATVALIGQAGPGGGVYSGQD